ncbi:MAG TPA: ABC transporter permease subunit [Acidisarcina sp.]
MVERSWPFFLDMSVALACLAAFYALMFIARGWLGHPVAAVQISHSARMLPLYAFYSCVRIFAAYVLSLIFAVSYGYIAAYNPRVEPLMLATLDILQSIPVLSFLPGVMLAMVSLFPTRQLGIELGAILLIFTGQVWNMAFSFYSSLKSIPTELQEAARVYRFTAWQRFWQLELPFSAIGLVWNSIVSVAGGWFILNTCEMFFLGPRDFRLAGLGSYLQTAASTSDTRATIYGVLTMLAIIVLTDQLLWRPIIAWSDKFKFENVESADRPRSPILYALRHSNLLGFIHQHTVSPLSERVYMHLAGARRRQTMQGARSQRPKTVNNAVGIVVVVLLAVAIIFAALHALGLLRQVHGPEVGMLLKGAGATFLRVNVSLLLAAIWTIPVGVAIGFQPRLARIAQPIAQIAASFPATVLFPVILIGLLRVGSGLGVGSLVLMLLATQWYILFNVIAGAMAIPSDLREVSSLYHFTRWQRWKTVILPGIFPYLITGLVTASGGAWNGSIIAEYFHLRGRTLETLGLGAQISAASDSGHFSILLLATIIMALMVVTINRMVWRPLYKLAETKYRIEV